jgi:predicted transcriptional regulator
MNHDIILAVLPSSKNDAKSLKEIANEIGLDINRYVDWIRAERRLSRSLRALAKCGWVALERRQREDGHKFWYNAYWKTELATQSEERTCYSNEWRSSARPANGPNSMRSFWVIIQDMIWLTMAR